MYRDVSVRFYEEEVIRRIDTLRALGADITEIVRKAIMGEEEEIEDEVRLLA